MNIVRFMMSSVGWMVRKRTGQPSRQRLCPSFLEDLTLALPRPSELVDLPYLAAEDEEQRCVIDPKHHDHDRSHRSRVQRPGVEGADVETEHELGCFEQERREDRRDPGRLRTHAAYGEELVQ